MRNIAWRKRIGALVLVFALLGVAGCGGDDSDEPSSTRSDEPVTLTAWDSGTIDPKLVKEWDDAYMKMHPNITIKRVHQPVNSYYTLIRTAIATQKGPDTFSTAPGPFMWDFYRAYLPLTDYVTDEDKEKLTGWDFVSAKDGTPYGIPWNAQGLNFYYNKELFRKAGLDPEQPPETWEDLLAACDALKGAGITPINAGWKDGYYAEWWLSSISPQFQSEEELDKAVTDPDWLSPGLIKGFEYLKDLSERGCFTPDAEGIPLFPDVVNNFKAGKAAMMLGLSASAINWSEFRGTKWGKKHLGAFLPPLMPGSNWSEHRYPFVPNQVNVVTKWSKHPQETYDFISYIANRENQEIGFERIGQFPNRTDVDPQTDDPVGAEIVGWVTDKEHVTDQVLLIRQSVEAALDKVVPQIITGEISPEEGLEQVQAEQDRGKPIPEH